MQSAGMVDRNLRTMIDIGRLKVGLTGIRPKLNGQPGTNEAIKTLDKVYAKTVTAFQKLQALASTSGYASYEIMIADKAAVQSIVKREEYRNIVRDVEADAFEFLQEYLSINNEPGKLKEDNIVLMASNTERDNRVSDGATDRFRVGGGNVGSQQRGISNVLDGSYFVPLDMMASGWNSMLPTKTTHYKGADPRDHYALLNSLTVTC